MKTDAIVIGAELDGLLAALRLCQLGHSTRVLSTGAGSLHYSPDGIHALGYLPGEGEIRVTSPLEAISHLDSKHPYRKAGERNFGKAIDWFSGLIGDIHQPFTISGQNGDAISAAGLPIPTYGVGKHQATIERLAGKRVTVVAFAGHRDFPAELVVAELDKCAIAIHLLQCDAPGVVVENAGLAKSFDALPDISTYFATIRDALPTDTEVVLFPAVMGLSRHDNILSTAQRILSVACLEVPTLPPSIPGMRLEQALNRHLIDRGVTVHNGAGISSISPGLGAAMILCDKTGRKFETCAVIVSSGGVLMGGLDVDSYGVVHETSLGLDTFQSEPLNAATVDQSLHALHVAGVETDCLFRPKRNGSTVTPNIFVTGRTLAHWNPAAESSAEGVCIATGWAAAQNAHTYIESFNHA